MRRVLMLSSYVARGTVGLQATLPALPAGIFDVIALPTVVLSNHPGHKACSGTALSPETLNSMVDALAANGWLQGLDGIFTGYLPSAGHVAVARHTVQRLKAGNPAVFYMADPVLGDDPGGLYIAAETANAVRDQLLPLADVTTPNRFELEWLTGQPVHDPASAAAASRHLGCMKVAATSVPAGAMSLANVLVCGGDVAIETVNRSAHAPHGTGDYFAGLLMAALLLGQSDSDAVRTASLGVSRVIAASDGLDHLNFACLTATHTARG